MHSNYWQRSSISNKVEGEDGHARLSIHVHIYTVVCRTALHLYTWIYTHIHKCRSVHAQNTHTQHLTLYTFSQKNLQSPRLPKWCIIFLRAYELLQWFLWFTFTKYITDIICHSKCQRLRDFAWIIICNPFILRNLKEHFFLYFEHFANWMSSLLKVLFNPFLPLLTFFNSPNSIFNLITFHLLL